ncbi:DUF3606 domain-containing protein [Citrobacter amalonaticus]|nr:DUF3606 domain-containing protein [Citrobacter amalonaticus]
MTFLPDGAIAYQAYKWHLYSKSFELLQDGKRVNLQERTKVRDWSERAQLTQKQLEG